MTETNHKTAIKILKYLKKYDIGRSVILYLNDSKYTLDKYHVTTKAEKQMTDDGLMFYVEHNVDVTKVLEYNNPSTLTMTFEDDFYDIWNYTDSEIKEEFIQIITDAGFYPEQGYLWSLTLYPV